MNISSLLNPLQPNGGTSSREDVTPSAHGDLSPVASKIVWVNENFTVSHSNRGALTPVACQIKSLKEKVAVLEEMSLEEHQDLLVPRLQRINTRISNLINSINGKRPAQEPLAAHIVEGELKRRRIEVESLPTESIVSPPSQKELHLQKTLILKGGGPIHKVVACTEGVVALQKRMITRIPKEGDRLPIYDEELSAVDIAINASSLLVIYQENDVIRRYSRRDFGFQDNFMDRQKNGDFINGLTKVYWENNQLAIGGKKGSVYLYDSNNDSIKIDKQAHKSQVTAITMNPKYLVPGSSDRYFAVYDKTAFGEGQPPLHKIYMETTVTALAMDGPIVYAGSKRGLLKIFEIEMGTCFDELLAGPIQEIIADDRGFYLATDKQIFYYSKPNETNQAYQRCELYKVQNEDTILSLSKSDEHIIVGLTSGALYFLS